MLARHNEPSSSNPPRLTAARHIEASSPKCLLLSLLLLVMRRSARHMSRAAQIHLLGSPSSPNCLLTLRRSAQKCSLSRAVQNGPEHNEPSSPTPPLLLGTLRRAECFLSRAVQNGPAQHNEPSSPNPPAARHIEASRMLPEPSSPKCILLSLLLLGTMRRAAARTHSSIPKCLLLNCSAQRRVAQNAVLRGNVTVVWMLVGLVVCPPPEASPDRLRVELMKKVIFSQENMVSSSERYLPPPRLPAPPVFPPPAGIADPGTTVVQMPPARAARGCSTQ